MSGRRHARYTQEEIKLILDNWHIQDQEHREAICRQMGRDFDSVNQKFYAILRSLKVKPKDYYAYKGLPPGVSLFAEDTEEKSETRTPKAAEPAAAAAEPRSTTVAFSDFRVVGPAKPIEASTTREHRANVVDFQPTSFRRTTEPGAEQKAVIDGTERKDEPVRIDESTRPPAIDGTERGETEPLRLPEEPISLEDVTDLSQVPLLLASHERRLKAIEARMTGLLTIKEFASMMRDLESAYDGQMKLMEELEQERKEKERLQEQVKRLERRVKQREEQLAHTIDLINARLLDHFRLNPVDKMGDLPDLEKDIKEYVGMAQRALGRQVV